jgi:hypothetical protein
MSSVITNVIGCLALPLVQHIHDAEFVIISEVLKTIKNATSEYLEGIYSVTKLNLSPSFNKQKFKRNV